MTAERSVVLLGSPVDDVTMSEAVERIAAMVALGRATGRAHQVATVNVDFLVKAREDPAVLEIMQRTDLAIPDGMGIVWGARAVGVPIRERTSGVDLLPALVERGAHEGWRICLFGAAPGVAAKAASLLTAEHPGAEVVGLEAPKVAGDGTMDPAALDAITAHRPDIVGVALGNPKQECWIARHGTATGAGVLIGIGGTLDFLTGVTRRAPTWMQRGGLEWIHRAGSEPRRLAGRYAKDLVVFGPALLRQRWAGRRRAPATLPFDDYDGDGRLSGLRLTGPAPLALLDRPVLTAADDGREIVVDATALDHVDNVTAAAVAGLVRRARRVGATVTIYPDLSYDVGRIGRDVKDRSGRAVG